MTGVDMQAIAGVFKHGILSVLALGLFAGFGPPLIPLPTVPLMIKDVHESLIMPPSRPLEGPLAPNRMLESATVLFNNTIQSSESVLLNEDGSLLLLDKYGRAFLAYPNSTAPGGFVLSNTPVAQLGVGRPLGFKKYIDGSIIVCVAGQGLVKLELPDLHAGTPAPVTLLGSYVSADSPKDPGTQILYANDLDITTDGSVVYFTDAQAIPVLPNWGQTGSKKVLPWFDTYTSFLMGIYSGQATGRLLAYYPKNGSIHVLSKGFWFSNGVALSPDESYLVIAETNTFRLLRYWIKGDKAGRVDVLIDGLPGFPDGVNTAKGGKGFWVAMPSPRSKFFDTAVKYRIVRTVLAWMPPRFRPPIRTWGAALLVSPEGEISNFLLDPNASHVSHLSDVDEEELPGGRSRIWLGSIKNNYIAYIDI